MSRSEKEALVQPSIENILRGLTERPNVQATLILSRKDGSIIRASGFISSGKSKAGDSTAPYQWSNPSEDAEATSQNIDSREADMDTKPQESQDEAESNSVAETLATSIYHFVNVATSLGSDMGSASRGSTAKQSFRLNGNQKESAGHHHKQTNGEDDQSGRSGEDEIQLLRLRTKEQEIIIFPDPRYLCCVVQNISRLDNLGTNT